MKNVDDEKEAASNEQRTREALTSLLQLLARDLLLRLKRDQESHTSSSARIAQRTGPAKRRKRRSADRPRRGANKNSEHRSRYPPR